MVRATLAFATLLAVLSPAWLTSAAETADGETASATNRHVTNPVSLTWSLKIENEILALKRDDASNRGQYQLKFQPTMPTLLTREWKLIVRPELVLVDDKPFTDEGRSRRTTGFGDTILDVVLSPVSDPWLLGIGPTFIFPTASTDETGQGNWQAGPAGLAGYLTKRWFAAVIAQQWFSYAGSAGRKTDSELHLQYLASLFLPHGWSVGTSPIIKFDWRAETGEQVTFPLGLFVAKVVTLGGRARQARGRGAVRAGEPRFLRRAVRAEGLRHPGDPGPRRGPAARLVGSRHEKENRMQRRTSSRRGVSVLAAIAMFALVAPAYAQTQGMDRRDNRRDNRAAGRATKQACKAGDEKTRAECRQMKRSTKQHGRTNQAPATN